MPGVKFEAFGSFRTKLYLPNADIDMVIIYSLENNNCIWLKVCID
jgi:DNA polymerase sigma